MMKGKGLLERWEKPFLLPRFILSVAPRPTIVQPLIHPLAHPLVHPLIHLSEVWMKWTKKGSQMYLLPI